MDFLNVIVANEHVGEWDRNNLFPDEEEVVVFRPGCKKDMLDLLVILGAFPSRSQARKNWKLTGAEIPTGWSMFFVGKHRRCLAIWNPEW